MSLSKPQSHTIFPWLLLANRDFATSRAVLRQHQITHVVFCTTGGHSHFADDGVAYFPILFSDDEHSVLSDLFNSRLQTFINQGKTSGRVAIVSDRGVSRCVAVALYYVVKQLNISLRDAFGLIKDAHRKAKPNADFVKQLKSMLGDYPLDLAEKPTLLDKAPKNQTSFTPDKPATNDNNDNSNNEQPIINNSDETTKEKIENSKNSNENDDENNSVDDNSIDDNSNSDDEDDVDDDLQPAPQKAYTYACRLCRHTIFKHSLIIPHSEMDGQSERFEGKSFWTRADTESKCQTLFLESVDWMDVKAQDGKLKCPKCNGKLGSWCWRGAQCACGRWCAPAFRVLKDRVDRKEPTRN